MRKAITILLAAILLLMPLVSFAEMDFSGLSFDELLKLRDEITKALWESEEWKEVVVPEGTYLVGRDIPAGHWTIAPHPDNSNVAGKGIHMKIGKYLKENGVDVDITKAGNFSTNIGRDIENYSLVLQEGYYIQISNGKAVFSRFIGYDFGF